MRSLIVALLFLSLFSISLSAQFDTVAVKSIEGITSKMLELISCDIDEVRDWDEYRNLFLPTAQKIAVDPKAKGRKQARHMSLEEFVRYVGPLYPRDGFKEVVIGLTINEFNGIANVFQSYHAVNLTGTYEERGVNSYQLVHMQDRWWIASTTFVNETDENPLPDVFLYPQFRTKDKE